MKQQRRIVKPESHLRQLPLAVESVGLNPAQEKVARPDGYPHYHWLQTLSGKGELTLGERTIALPAGTGALLFPGVPHAYEAASAEWETAYLTFGGGAADGILASLGVHDTALYELPAESPAGRLVERIVDRLETEADVFGIAASADAYRFLLALTRYGAPYGKSGDPGRLDKLRQVVEWMERRYADPDVGIDEISDSLQLSNRRLTALFRETFGQPPYAYFIQLRLRKAKEMLVGSSPLTIRDVALRVGFRDASHFVATFRKHVGMTPERFRRLH